MSVLRILSTAGDTTVEWDIKDEKSVQKVRKEFDRIMTQGGMQAFRIDSPTEGELIRSFDPTAQEIIVTLPMIGG